MKKPAGFGSTKKTAPNKAVSIPAVVPKDQKVKGADPRKRR